MTNEHTGAGTEARIAGHGDEARFASSGKPVVPPLQLETATISNRQEETPIARAGEPFPTGIEQEPPATAWIGATPPDETPGAHGKRRLIVLIGAIAALGGIAYWTLQPAGDGGDFTVRREALRQIVAGRGRIEPRAEVAVAATSLGRLTSVLVDEGQQVTAGQLLAVMQDDELRAQVARAEAQLAEALARLAQVEAGARPQEIETARARVAEQDALLREATARATRFQALAEASLIPLAQVDESRRQEDVAKAQQRSAREQLALIEAGARPEELEAARAQVERARSELSQVRTQLANTRITAPFGGVVTKKYLGTGEVVVLQRPQPILILADASKIYIRAEIDESDIQKVRPGQPVMVRSSTFPGRTFKATVGEIGRAAGRKTITGDDAAEIQDTRVVEVLIELPSDVPWTFGATADVEILVVDKTDALVVPRTAVDETGGAARVSMRTGDGTVTRDVTLGAQDDEFVEVLAGLDAGDIVIIPR